MYFLESQLLFSDCIAVVVSLQCDVTSRRHDITDSVRNVQMKFKYIAEDVFENQFTYLLRVSRTVCAALT